MSLKSLISTLAWIFASTIDTTTTMNTTHYYRQLVILNGLVPMLVLASDAYSGQLGANSVNYALHVTGILSLLFLILSLSMTPLRWLTGWSGWIAFRRSLGLYGFAYSLLHVAIYIGFDRGLSLASTLQEIWMRRFLQVGTMAVFLMIPLAVTSTSAMIQRIGPKRWKLLHRLAYVVAALGVIHYYMLVKSDIRQPVAVHDKTFERERDHGFRGCPQSIGEEQSFHSSLSIASPIERGCRRMRVQPASRIE